MNDQRCTPGSKCNPKRDHMPVWQYGYRKWNDTGHIGQCRGVERNARVMNVVFGIVQVNRSGGGRRLMPIRVGDPVLDSSPLGAQQRQR